MSLEPRTIRLLDLPLGIEVLDSEAAVEGFRFPDKLIVEWLSGKNRFDLPGEVLLGTFLGDELIAVGGLNHDPYLNQDGIGRLRHLYVKKSYRQLGLGTALVRNLLTYAERAFHSVRLRTDTPDAGKFYASLGFQPVQDETASHAIYLQK